MAAPLGLESLRLARLTESLPFRRADAAVAIEIEQIESAFVKLDSFGGASEGDPKLLIEVFEIHDVRAVSENDLKHAADADEFPAMRGGAFGNRCGPSSHSAAAV